MTFLCRIYVRLCIVSHCILLRWNDHVFLILWPFKGNAYTIVAIDNVILTFGGRCENLADLINEGLQWKIFEKFERQRDLQYTKHFLQLIKNFLLSMSILYIPILAKAINLANSLILLAKGNSGRIWFKFLNTFNLKALCNTLLINWMRLDKL